MPKEQVKICNGSERVGGPFIRYIHRIIRKCAPCNGVKNAYTFNFHFNQIFKQPRKNNQRPAAFLSQRAISNDFSRMHTFCTDLQP